MAFIIISEYNRNKVSLLSVTFENMKEISTILINIGQKVFQRRKELNLTQDELAVLADIDRTYIGYIENGKQNITISVLIKIAKALNVEPNYFFND